MEIIDIRAEINKSENKNNREKSVKPKGDFKKISKIGKPIARMTKKEDINYQQQEFYKGDVTAPPFRY